ncbi:hypothetical protein [uncultured Robinsoniella sp.]|uniref:hypothetical protein n=1 Tax=uncultured Robinsoniella sp. TaxID=904190 RepID=UPI00374E622E
MPHLMPLHNADGTYKREDKPTDRFMMVDISFDDVKTSELRRTIVKLAEAKMKGNNMYEQIIYDHPIVTKELNNNKIMLYEAWGIPKENIKYELEFVNKTKQTYLNVTGHAKWKDLGFENDINIHMLIDTDIYEGYEVGVTDGMVVVTFHEIKNEQPKLKDYRTV